MVNFEITPKGNGITLEDEMMKVTTNMMDYQAATSLYQKSVRILKTALGKTA
jgi:flagellar basal-body rod protein FlgB